jgi:hypothetical protein
LGLSLLRNTVCSRFFGDTAAARTAERISQNPQLCSAALYVINGYDPYR